MSRRRKRDPNAPKLLGLADVVNPNLSRLEQAVTYQTVLRKFSFAPEEIVACMLPPEDIETLRRAEPLVLGYYSKQVRCEFGEDNTYPCSVTIDLEGMGIALWRSAVCKFQYDAPRAADLLRMIEGVSHVRQRFSAVSTLVEWFDRHASWGAVRYYWPSACALLPNDHLIHRMDGTAFREPKTSIGNMIPLCRETAMTIAEAMLCPLEIPPAGIPPAGKGSVYLTVDHLSFAVPLPPL